MPCGCGGAAFYHETPGENDMGYVECSQCGIGTPDMFPECAEKTWNTAMRFNLDETSENPGIVGHDGQEDEDE